MPEWKETVNLPRTDFPMKASLPATDLVFLQQVLADSLRSVYTLFVGVAVLATVVARITARRIDAGYHRSP